MWQIIVLIIYFVSVIFIIVFSIGQLSLIILFLRSRGKHDIPLAEYKYPLITVQLPVYNERFVISRLLRAVAKLDYPKELLEIQVLDDSTDETKEICRKIIRELSAEGFNISHLHRNNRHGFKAGALQEGLVKASGEFIAIFDADFIPQPDFLKRSIPYFTTNKIGLVQTRWGHINRSQSWLTRVQALGLDGHFIIDQTSRAQSGMFINFNGTAGIWRKSCIEDAGGWQYDTLTEDLDLSYRAQIRGWELRYSPDIITPAELPSLLNSVRSQQSRWIKGGVETSKKIFGRLWNCDSSLTVKLFGSFHLLSNYIYLFILINSILSVPALFIKNLSPALEGYFQWSPYFAVVFIINALYCFITVQAEKKRFIASIREFAAVFPMAIFISLGMSLSNSVAIIQGITGRKTSFVRTPKFMLTEADTQTTKATYIPARNLSRELPEMLVFCYFLFAAAAGVYFRDIGFLMYHLMLLGGFGVILHFAFQEIRIQQRSETKTAIDLEPIAVKL